jgi:hypothetical protein
LIAVWRIAKFDCIRAYGECKRKPSAAKNGAKFKKTVCALSTRLRHASCFQVLLVCCVSALFQMQVWKLLFKRKIFKESSNSRLALMSKSLQKQLFSLKAANFFNLLFHTCGCFKNPVPFFWATGARMVDTDAQLHADSEKLIRFPIALSASAQNGCFRPGALFDQFLPCSFYIV